MPGTIDGRRGGIRRALLVSSALVAGMGLPSLALAQDLPIPNLVAGVGTADITPDRLVNPTALEVDLNGRNQIINWVSFNIGNNRTVNFTGAPDARLTVINRVGPLAPSTINGTLNAANINVFLINPEGVTFGRTGSFSGGGLVVSTLPLQLSTTEEAAFIAAGGTLPASLTFNGGLAPTATRIISFAGGQNAGTITASGSIVAIAQRVENAKTLTATDGGSVALVAASDVTFNSGIDNPLNITLTAGTTIGTAGVAAGGAISGGSVVIAGGAVVAITGALLGVTANQITATATDGAVVIASASTSAGNAAIDITNGVTPEGDPIVPGITVRGGGSGLNATGTNGDVIVNGAGSVTIDNGSGTDATTGGLIARRDVVVNAGGAIDISGAVSAGRDYAAAGTGVTIGRSNITLRQSAGGAVSIASTDGNIDARGAFTLRSGIGASGSVTLSAPDGTINFTPETRIDAGGDVFIAASGNVALGAVSGTALTTSGDPDGLLRVAGDFSARSVAVGDALGIRADGTIGVTGAVSVSGDGAAIDLRGTRVTVDSAATNGGDILLSGRDGVTLHAATTFSTLTAEPGIGSIALLSGGTVRSDRTLQAGEDVSIRAGGLTQIGSIIAGDDAIIDTTGALFIGGITTDATGADDRAVGFTPAEAGLGGIAIAAPEGVAGSNIRITAASITSAPALTGTDAGNTLVIEQLSSGDAILSAARATPLGTSGDLRIGQVTTGAGDLVVMAADGSISGLGPSWTNLAGGASLVTTGNVSIASPGTIALGLIDAGGTVAGVGTLGATRIRRVEAGSLDLTATGGLQIGTAEISGSALLTNLGGTPGAFSQTGTPLVLGEGGRAGFDAAGDLTVSALNGAAQLGVAAGGTVDIRADAVDASSATARSGSLFMLAESGRLTLGDGGAATTATLWKRDDDAVTNAADVLAVTGVVTGGTGVEIRSVSDARVAGAVATTGDLVVQAAGTAMLDDGTAVTGSVALLAGGAAASATRLVAGVDVGVRAGAGAALGAVRAGDDIDLQAAGDLSLVSATTLGSGADSSAITFVPALAGQGDPTVAGTGGVTIGAAEDVALAGSNIRLRAASVSGPGMTGSTDAGLVVERLTAGAGSSLNAALGDIRVGSLTTNAGALDVAAGVGSVSGLRSGWAAAGAGSSLVTTGQVIIDVPGAVTIGSIDAGGAVTGVGLGSGRFGSIGAASLTLSADADLQVGVAVIDGAATLSTAGGVAGAFDLIGTTLVNGYGRADLDAAGALTVQAAGGVAQLGATLGSVVDIQADAVDVASATARTGSLFLLAESGRLVLGTGAANNVATLWKRDDDATGGDADALIVTGTLTGAAGVAVRSQTDARVAGATATTGDIVVEAVRDVSLGTGVATAGTLALLGGRDVASATSLSAGEDVSVHAVRGATLTALAAGDDVDLLAGGRVSLTRAETLGTGGDARFVTFAPSLAGAGDPRVAGTGGVTIGAPEDGALAGSNIRIRAAEVSGAGLTGSIDAGLVVERLTAGAGSSLNAALGDIRVGSATTSTGALDVTAGAGSVSGLRDDWVAAGGGATLVTPGQVTIEASGAVTLGSITADGAVTATGLGSGRFGAITAASLDLSGADGLQVGVVNVAGTARLATTGGAAGAFDLAGTPLVAGYGAANLDARGALAVTALSGVAQLGEMAGSTIDVRADALSVTEATARTGGLTLLAEAGRLTLGTGSAAAGAILAKRNDDGAGGDADALFVTTTLTAGTGIDVRSASDANIVRATATMGDLAVQAARDVSLGTGAATAGTLALLAGRDAGSAVRLSAAEDVSVSAGRDATLASLSAGDDIDLATGNALFLTDATTLGTGGDARASVFTPAQAGLGDPLTTGTGGITIGAPEAAALTGSNIRIRAATVGGPALNGSTDAGLVVERLTSGATVIEAAAGDVRLGSVTSNAGALDLTAGGGSVSGLRDGWTAASGGSTLTTPGQVTIEAAGAVTIGAIDAGGGVTGTGITAGRFGAIAAARLDLSAGAALQIGVATVAGTTRLATSGGSAGAFDLVGTPLVAGYGAAALDARGALTVRTPGGVVQLGAIAGDSIDVRADAVDIVDATARTGSLFVLAEAGRLTLDTGRAGTMATLAKRDDDGAGGDADALFVTTALTGGAGIDVRSASDATLARATATTTGDLTVQAARDVSLATGIATAGTVAVLAGRDIASATRLEGGEDVSLSAGRDATLRAVQAGDDVDLRATRDLFLADVTTLGTGGDTRAVTFTPAQAGRGDPLVAGTGGIAIGAPEDAALAGSTIRLRASRIGSPALAGSTDTGLVIEELTSGSATLDAALADFRLGRVATAGDLAIGAGAGSVTGLAAGWTATTGGATLTTPGRVIVGASLAATFGNIVAGGAVVSDGTLGAARFGRIVAGSLSLTATGGLQIGTAAVVGATSLSLTGGGAAAFDPVGTSLVADYGAAALEGGGALALTARQGAAQLGTIAGASVAVTADAVDVAVATARATTLSMTAETGRLTIGTGTAATGIALTKLDQDAVIGVPRADEDTLFAGTLLGGTDVTAFAAGNAIIGSVTATGGLLDVNAAGTVDLRFGQAGGDMRLLSTLDILSTDRLIAGGDLAVTASRTATVASAVADGALSITAGVGGIDLGTGRAGTTATLVKQGDDDGLVVRESLVAGADIVLDSSTDVLAELVDAGNNLGVRSGGDTMIRTGRAGAGITIDAGASFSSDATLVAGDNLRIDAGRRIDVADATATRGTLTMIAQGGPLVLGTGLAGADALLVNLGTSDAGLIVSGSVTGGNDVTIRSATAAFVEGATAIGNDLRVATGGDAMVRVGAAGRDLSIDAGGNVVSDVGLTAGRDAAVAAVGAATIANATATDGSLSIRADNEALTLGTGRAGIDATLTTLGTGAEATLMVTGSVTGGNDVTIGSATGAFVEAATATMGSLTVETGQGATVRVGAAGDVLGIVAGGDVASDTSLVAGGDLAITAGGGMTVADAVAGGSLALVTQGGSLTLGSALAGVDATIRSATDATIDAVTARTGDLTVAAQRTLNLTSATAGDMLDITAGEAAAIGSAASGGLAVVTTGATATIDTIVAGTALTIAAGVDAVVRNGSAGAGLSVSAARDLVSDAALVAGGGMALTAGRDATVANATAGGSLALVTQGGSVTLGSALAGVDATIRSAADATIDTVTARAGDLTIAAGRTLDLTSATAGDMLDITAGEAAAIGSAASGGLAVVTTGATATIDTIVAGTALTIAAGVDAVVRNGSAGAGLSVSAARDLVSDAALVAGGGMALTAGRDATVANATAAGTLSIETRGGAMALGSALAGADATIRSAAGAVIDRVEARTGDLTVETVGTLALGNGVAGADLMLTAGEAARIGSATAGGNGALATGTSATIGRIAAEGALTISAGTDVTIGTGTAGGALSVTTGNDLVSDTALRSGAGMTITTGRDATIANATAGTDLRIDARGAIGSTGALSAARDATLIARGAATIAAIDAGRTLDVTADRLTLGTATAGGNGAITAATTAAIDTARATGNLAVSVGSDGALRTGAAGGNLSITTGRDFTSDTSLTAGHGIAVSTGGNAAIANATATGGAITVTTQGSATVGTGSAGTGVVLTGAGPVVVTGSVTGASDVTIRSTAGVTANQATATAGMLLVDTAGDANVRTGVAGTDLTINGRNVTSAASLAAGRNVTINAAQGTTLATATARNGALAVTAETGDLALGTGNAGTTATLTKRGATGGITIGAALTATGGVTLDSAGAIEVSGPVTSGGMITAINSGTGATAIGGASGAAGFALAEAEVNRLRAANIVVDSGTRDVTIGKLAIESATGGTALRFLTTGNVAVTGAVSGSNAGTLQIGGRLGTPSGTVDPGTLARRITADVANGTVSYANGTLDLRALRVAFGSGAEFNTYIGLSNDEIARIVANAGSGLYVGNTTRATFLTAKTLTVSYSDFALFQNSAPGVSGGAVLGGTGNSLEQTALQLYSTGDQRDNSFAIFGTINGFVGRAAGVLPNEVLNIADSNPRTLRITQSNSRVNGCVIGSPDRGCLVTDVPRTEFRLYDERQTALFTTADPASLYANPLVGRGNEGLIVDIADVPVGIDTIDCPEDEPNCRTPGSQK